MVTNRKNNHTANSKRVSPRKPSSVSLKKVAIGKGKEKGKKSADEETPVVVGIGASAGGLESISQLLVSLPANPGLSIIFVQHLSSTHESALVELLRRKTTLTVLEVQHGMRVQANHVYVISPGVTVELKDGACIVTKIRKQDGVFHPVDVLFRSIAKEYGSRSIGVVLSGTATDGTEGLLAIKEAGGITLVQDKSAKYFGMPQSAIDAGAVDFILPPEDIAKELLIIAKHPYTTSDKNIPVSSESGVRKILSFIQSKFNIDFTNYKRPMIERRITRRMILARVKTLDDYARYLEDTKGEDVALQQDLLINVTSFFRDTELMASLSTTVLPALLKGRESKDDLRIWVPGCSTGQEVYSIAIILSEVLEKMHVKPQFTIKIFGTDASEQAIEKARIGIYPKSVLGRLSPARLSRFFQPVDGSYQMHKSLREMCVFSPHNFLKDPPFSRMDLISCQNVLIYFDATLQKKAIRTFHYALKPTGYLALGKSETVGVEGNMFIATEKKQKIYTKKPGTAVGQIVLPSRSQASLKNQKRGGLEEGEASIEDEADKMLLAHFTPASMVVNADMEILRFKGATSMYLEPAGSASLNLLKMVREELVLELRSLLHIAKKEDRRTRKEGIPMKRNGKVHLTSIEVVPLKHEAHEVYFMILFSETTPAEDRAETGPQSARKSDAKEKRIAGLIQELVLQKVQMKSMGEEYEAANEELQSANEEVLSSNEELQSINEELETSQEELQSTNEELMTINDELGARNREIAISRDYAEAIITTIREPLIVLNHDLRVKTANEIFYSQFKSTPIETEGRLLYELGNGQWDIPRLRKLLNEILPKDKVVQNFEIEHEFPQIGRKTMLLNARTVAEHDGKESLILLAVQDITDRKGREEALQKSEENYRTLFELGPVAVYSVDAAGVIQNFNYRAGELWGREPVLGDDAERFSGAFKLFHPDGSFMPPDQCPTAEVVRGKIAHIRDAEAIIERPDGSRSTVVMNIRSLKSERGEVIGAINCFYDITERKRSEDAAARLAAIVSFSADAIISKNLQGIIQTWNQGAQDIFGYTPEEAIGKPATLLIPADRSNEEPDILQRVGRGETVDHYQTIRQRKDGSLLDVSLTISPIRNASGNIIGASTIARDVSDQVANGKKLEEASRVKDEFLSMASHELRTPVTSIKGYAQILHRRFIEAKDMASAELVSRLGGQADALTALIADLFDDTKVKEGKLELHRDYFDFNELVGETVDEVQYTTTQHRITCVLAKMGKVYGDRARIKQVIVNLLTNAIKYSPSATSVKVVTKTSARNTVLSVQDFGVGISKEDQSKIFARFYRVRGKDLDTYPGLGLGLYIAAKMIERHGGHMTVKSRKGNGSTFSISLPIKEPLK